MSDEIKPSSEAAPDGAQPPEHDPDEVMTRASTRKLVNQRNELKKGFDDLTAEFQAQAKELEALRAQAGKPPEDPDMPEWAKAVMTKVDGLGTAVDGLGTEFTTYKTTSASDTAIKAILAQVPDGAKDTVRVMLPGLGVDLTSSTAVADAMAALQTNHSAILVDVSRGKPRRAPQVGSDNKPDFSACKSWDDIPLGLRGHVPDEVAARLSGRGVGDGKGQLMI